ncbi:MAG: aminopeptidase N [Gammaproteobacteria bacterium]|nr:aminopeptidase N [Gammaproteobacteria bacterium]
MSRANPKTVYLKDYQPPEYLIDRVTLHITLDENSTRVVSKLSVRRNPLAVSRTEGLHLDGEELEPVSIELNGVRLQDREYKITPTGLTIHTVPDQFQLETEVLVYPQNNTALEGLYKSGDMYCTQCEAEGFRKISWYLDRPDVMSEFTTTILARKMEYPVLLSNGNPVARGELEDGRHWVTWEDPIPKPAYLFALVAGDLLDIRDSYTTASGRCVDLRIYVEPENIDKCDHAMRSLKQSMRWDEQNYGREYDLDIFMIVAVNDFNMGAMENKGLNIFNSKYVLARPDTATDRDFQGIEGVIAHEYFHNWTGNRITCRDWFQLSLKEGLTVFRDQEFSADMGSRGVKRVEDVRMLRAHQFAEDASPMAHAVRPDSYMEINNFYTLTVYEKGAEVVRMQHSLLGSEGYRKGTDLYFERHDGQAVTTDDFVKCMEDASGRDLAQFRRWYSKAGTPELQCSGEYHTADNSYTLTVEQSCPDTPGQTQKKPFHIPFAVGLLAEDGADLPLRLKGESSAAGTTRVLELTRAREQFHFNDLPVAPVPSLLRGFSAPIKVSFDYTDDELLFLMAHDSDGFNRWDASQRVSLGILMNVVNDPDYTPAPGFIAACREALIDTESDQALLAEILTLPAESYLGDQMGSVDVVAIHNSREALKLLLAQELKDDFFRVYHQGAEQGGYDLSPQSIARRRLRNLSLDYLMQLDDPEITGLCIEQYQSGHNMTDVITALGLIASSEAPGREGLLADFYQRWKHDQLVLDKWFMVQAVSKRKDTIEHVRQLMQHPGFSMHNPNKVRSLIGAFCSANPIHFHAADGSGYLLLGDVVQQLDPINPQIAARMLRSMARWRRYDAERQLLMKQQLEKILSIDGISKDVFEVASKCLV